MSRDAKLYEFCDKLIAAAGERRGLKWARFVSHVRVEAELKRRGYKLTQGYPGEWFAGKLPEPHYYEDEDAQ